MTETRRGGWRAGFTLIELLVVVAIIALLMSILTPSLSRARQQAKSAHCMTRLSEFLKGLTAYSNDHNFQLPPLVYENYDYAGGSPRLRSRHGWAELLYQDMYRADDFSLDHDFPVQRNRAGRFELWQCKEGEPLADSTGHYRPYEVAWEAGAIDRVPHRLPLIMDANPRVTFAEDLEISYIEPARLAGLQGEAYVDERHYGRANYVFNDGHVESSASLKEQLALDWDLDPDTENEDVD